MSALETDADRRLAQQLAIQLPAEIARARRVLALTSELLEEWMIAPPASTAHGRARRLGWGGVVIDMRPVRQVLPRRRTDRLAPYVWIAASLALTVPLAMLLYQLVGAGGGVTLAVGVVATALVFGTWPALLIAGLSPVALNLLVIPPAWEFSRPQPGEYVIAGFYLVLALGVPWLVRARRRLRRAVVTGLPAAAERLRRAG